MEGMAIREAMEHDVELATKEDIVANLAKEAEEVVLTLTIKAKMVDNKTQNVATMMNKEDEEEVKEDDLEAVVDVDKEGYKDDGWWVRITERINKVGECVKEGRDLEPEEEVEEAEQETGSQQEDEEQEKVAGSEAEFTVLKNRLDRTEKSLDNLGK